jgi:uncharacterized membrane protein YjjP (DUF1212 family)
VGRDVRRADHFGMRSRRPALLLALTAGFASVPLLVLRSGEVQVVTVALILGIAIVLLRTRPVEL